MKKQFLLFMYTGIMAGAVMTSCKSSDSVTYDSDRVYTAPGYGSISNTSTASKSSARPEKNGKVVYSAATRAATTNQVNAEPVNNQPIYEAAATPQQMPQIIDMSVQNQPSPYYNYNQYEQAQVYTAPYNSRPVYQRGSGRNRSLDNNLYNRPDGRSITYDMYTPEYRAMMNGYPTRSYNSYSQPVNNDPYAGLMTVENGNVVPYNSQPRVVQQQQYYPQPQQQYYGEQYQQQYQNVQPQQYVAPAQPQQVYATATENYAATLYFKNGAKLTGTLVRIDNSICQFKMSEGRVVNFSTQDIQRIEKR